MLIVAYEINKTNIEYLTVYRSFIIIGIAIARALMVFIIV